ncbi:MAG: YbgA family protein [Burkholderiales bacterium]
MDRHGPRIRLGISSCLLGEKVRFDGNHKHDSFLTGTLGQFFEWVPVCPEVAIGLGIPRPPIRLTGSPAAPRAVGVKDPDMDVTDRLADYGRRQARKLDDICGYIFKSKSPSCGMERVKVHHGGAPAARGRGIYADAFLTAQPWLPAEEEGRLGDLRLRENFIERVFVYRRWQDLTDHGLTAARLVDFHTRHKLALMAHDVEGYRALGRFVAGAGGRISQETGREYIRRLMESLKRPATPARHANVLMHLIGYLKQRLHAEDKAELLELIHAYRRGQAPFAAPLTLLRHHFRRFPDPYVARQTYLHPDPRELLLRGA